MERTEESSRFETIWDKLGVFAVPGTFPKPSIYFWNPGKFVLFAVKSQFKYVFSLHFNEFFSIQTPFHKWQGINLHFIRRNLLFLPMDVI